MRFAGRAVALHTEMNDGIQFSELLAYTEEENTRWRQFFGRHPEALDLPLDIAGDVRQLVLHIFVVELYFANIVAGHGQVDLDALPTATLDDIFGVGELAARTYREFFARAKAEDWSEMVALNRIDQKGSKRKLIAHALTHSMRHWAQISTYLRQQGLKQEWHHDWLMSRAME